MLLGKSQKKSQYKSLKNWNSFGVVIPAEAGIQLFDDVLDPGFRRGDKPKRVFAGPSSSDDLLF